MGARAEALAAEIAAVVEIPAVAEVTLEAEEVPLLARTIEALQRFLRRADRARAVGWSPGRASVAEHLRGLARAAPRLRSLLRRHGFDLSAQPPSGTARGGDGEALQQLLEDLELEQSYAVDWRRPIGEGSFGAVFRARCRGTGGAVAIKRTKLQHGEEGIPATTLREVATLKMTRHPNIVRLLDVACKHGSLDLIFEYLPANLKQHMERHGPRLGSRAVRSLQHQLLLGLDFCHSRRIMHRDLKPANLLVQDAGPGGEGQLKIADFGLARVISTTQAPAYTPGMVTAWYRSPEILFGGEYTLPVDVWSAGCIFGEMVRGVPLFYGSHEIEIILSVFRKLGTPQGELFPENAFPHFKPTFPQFPRRSWEDICGLDAALSQDAFRLLDEMLQYDAGRRISARRALLNPYFTAAAAQ